MKKDFLLLIIFFLVSTFAFSQQVNLVKDINNSTNNYGSNPSYTVALGSSVVFVANDPITGGELWISNGSSAGTTLIKDIYPGGFGSYPYGLTNIGGTIYFYADDGVNGPELWKTDGTQAGTVLVKDINPGPGGSYPSEFTLFSGSIYFRAYTDAEGYELWKTDGTTAGTVLVGDINTGNGSSYPSGLKALGTTALIFQAYTATNGTELYSYNGTSFVLKDIVAGAGGSNPYGFTYNSSLGLIFFTAYDATYGYELWKTNGDFSTGTSAIDIVAGSGSSYPYYITSYGSNVFFQAYHSSYGYELWKSNGGAVGSGTSIVADLVSGTGSSSPYYLTATGGGLFFYAYDATNGYALRFTTGTSISMVANTAGMYLYQIIPNPSSANVYFSAYTSANGYELWKATSTTATMIKDIVVGTGSSYPYWLVFNGSIFFSADDGTKGNELWYSDGTEPNTVSVKDINSATDSNIYSTIPTTSGFLLSANDGVNGQEVWKTDATTAGTTLVKDILSGAGGSNPQFLGKVGSNYLFTAYDNTNGQELWKTDGTTVNTTLVKDIESGINGSYPYEGVVIGSVLYFNAYTSANGYELWKSDGTTAGTVIVKDVYPGIYGGYPNNLTAVGTTLFFSANDGTNGNELWKSDGTSAGTVQVKNINVSGSSYPYNLTNVNGTLFFTADDGANGNELWKSDGTSAGTVAPKDIYSGSGSSYPANIKALGSIAYFIANDGTNGYELWKSDGTLAGTTLLKDIYSGTGNSSYPQNLTPAGLKLYFTAYEPTTGTELWSTDGTTANTVLVKDIRTGAASSNAVNLSNINGSLYFMAADGASGNLLYKSNGVTAFKATSSGVVYDYAGPAMYYNGKVMFTGNTNTYGNELLSVMAEPLNQPTSLNFTGKSATSISASFTAASGSPSGYIVLRKAGSAPTDLPIDGAPYTVGATIGTSTVAAIGSGSSFTDNFTASASPSAHYYSIFSYNNDGVANIYRPYSPLQGNSTPLASEPTAQPTGFTVSSATTTSYTVSFTAASGSPAGYLVLRIAGATAPTDVPVDGNAYTQGSALGSSTITYIGSTLSFSQTGLSAGQSYSYAIFSYNGSTGTYNYLTASPLTATAYTLVAEPTAQPTALIFSGNSPSSITLTFTSASPAPSGGYLVMRNTTSSVNAPADGTSYTAGASAGASKVVYIGSGTTFTDNLTLSAGTAYYYAVYSFNGTGGTINYLTVSPLTGNSFTLATEPATQPSAFAYSSPTTSSYTVSFTAASGSPNGYIGLRISGTTPPTDIPTDGIEYSLGSTIGSGTVAFLGDFITTSFNETGLASGSAYSYAIFSVNGSTGTYNYLTTSPLTGTATTLATSPSAQPTALVFSSVQASSMTVGWTAATGSPAGYLVIRKAGSAPTGIPVNASVYTAGQGLGDGTVVYSGSATSFNDAGLTAATNYFYQIFSFNGSGASSNYRTASPLSGNTTTLDAEPTIQPTNLSFSNVGLTTLTTSFTASASPPVSGYIVIRNTGSVPTGVPSDGVIYTVGNSLSAGTGTVAYVGSNTSFTESGLTSQTTYHYAVYAFNNVAGPINYLTANPLVNNVTTLTADTTPPVITNTTPATVASGLNTKITATITDAESGVSSVSLQYRSISGSTTYTTVPMTLTTGNNWESSSILAAQIGDVGLEFKITATNAQTLSTTTSSLKTLVSFADQNLPYSAFGSDVTNYRIISVPMALTSKSVANVFGDNLGAYNDTEYRLFHFENGANKELTSSSNIDLGKGYWFIAKTSKAINTGPGTAANVTADQPYTISLVSGWNQIGNPYFFNVLWDDVLAASGNISLKLRTYEGSFTDASTLDKFEGAFVFANAATTLIFPTAKNSSVNGRRKTGNEPLTNAIDDPEWDVVFTLQNGIVTNELTGIGMRPGANDDYDKFDDFTLPRLFEYLELNHQKSFLKTAYSKDVVPTAENKIWEFSIDSNLGEGTELKWDNSYFGNNQKQIVLIDVEDEQAIDMRQRNSYWFNGLSRKFKVVFGNPDFVRENTFPERLMINHVFPNPSAADVTVGFTTPAYPGEAKVEVKLHTMLGQAVNNLFEGPLASGYHEVVWDGTDSSGARVSQGVYLIEVKIGKSVRTEKMIIK